VVANEWDTKHLSSKLISETKRMLEGHGGMYELKGCDPFIAFKGANFLYTANTLHPLLTKPSAELDEEEKAERGAINSRMKRHKFTVSYKNTDKIPYTEDDIALALHYLCYDHS
jgi:hypothetical protein